MQLSCRRSCVHLYCTLLIFSSANVTITVYFNIHVMAVYLLLLNNHVSPLCAGGGCNRCSRDSWCWCCRRGSPPSHTHTLTLSTIIHQHSIPPTYTDNYSLLFYTLSLLFSLPCNHCLLSISHFSLCYTLSLSLLFSHM